MLTRRRQKDDQQPMVTAPDSAAEPIADSDDETDEPSLLASLLTRIETLLELDPIETDDNLEHRCEAVSAKLSGRFADDAHRPDLQHISQIAAMLSDLRAAAGEQVAFLTEASEAADRMQNSIVENSRLAQSASEAVAELSTRTESRTTDIFTVVSTLQESAERATESLTTIFDLSDSSNQIAGMARTINDIADRTKILAFNAAIAAARAGEQGREFGVIAEQIRELATRTAETARDITRVIGGLEEDTRGAAEVMQQVDTGLVDVDHAGDSLREIAAETDELSSTVDEITNHSRSQSAATSDVLFGIDAAAMTAEQITESLQSLGDLIDQLIVQPTIDNPL